MKVDQNVTKNSYEQETLLPSSSKNAALHIPHESGTQWALGCNGQRTKSHGF